jgi:transcriptional regulator with XRE-family HTH domain
MLSKKIKALRKEKGLSQEKLAQQADVTYSTLVKIESGININPTLDTLQKLAEVFGVSIDELVGRKG